MKNKIQHLFQIVTSLMEYKTMSVLCDELYVTERTVYRIMHELSDLGFEVEIQKSQPRQYKIKAVSDQLHSVLLQVYTLSLTLKINEIEQHDGTTN